MTLLLTQKFTFIIYTLYDLKNYAPVAIKFYLFIFFSKFRSCEYIMHNEF